LFSLSVSLLSFSFGVNVDADQLADHGVCTLIPSQPITCLQMCGADGVWRYVPYVKDTVVANLGDVMEVASGGIFKATRHRGECGAARTGQRGVSSVPCGVRR
jgi:isopenicillin N synthase-like dioxygenase